MTKNLMVYKVKPDIIKRPSKRKDIREGILKIETALRKIPGALIGDSFPLKHTFADGMYVREMFVPKGYLVVTKIHKFSHPCFILKGDCSVLSEDGPIRIKAPFHMITPAGTKRVVYVHEDTTWVTVHATKETDLEKIEEEVISKNFDEFDNVIDVEAEKIEIENFVKEVTNKKGEA